MPINVTNSIEESDQRPSCDALDNPLLDYDVINATAANSVGVLFAPGDATTVEQSGSSSGSGAPGNTGGLGAAATIHWSGAAVSLAALSFFSAVLFI